MPLISLSVSTSIKWTLSSALAGFAAEVQDDPGQAFTLASINLAQFGQLRADNYNIPANGYFDFDLWSFVDLNSNLTGFTLQGVLALFVLPLVGEIFLAPSPSNGLQWPFTNLNLQGLDLTPGGVFMISRPPAGPAYPVAQNARNIRATNQTSSPAQGYFIAVGG